MIEPGQPPRELNRLDSKNWTPTPEDLQRELADRVVDAGRPGRRPAPARPGRSARDRRRDRPGEARRPTRPWRTNPGLIVLADSRRGLRDFPPLGFKMNAAELARMTRIERRRARGRAAARPPSSPAGPASRSSSRWPSTGSSARCRAGPRARPGPSGPRPDRHRRRRRRRHRQPGRRPGRRGRPPRGHGARHGRRLARDPPARDHRHGVGCPDRRIARPVGSMRT